MWRRPLRGFGNRFRNNSTVATTTAEDGVVITENKPTVKVTPISETSIAPAIQKPKSANHLWKRPDLKELSTSHWTFRNKPEDKCKSAEFVVHYCNGTKATVWTELENVPYAIEKLNKKNSELWLDTTEEEGMVVAGEEVTIACRDAVVMGAPVEAVAGASADSALQGLAGVSSKTVS